MRLTRRAWTVRGNLEGESKSWKVDCAHISWVELKGFWAFFMQFFHVNSFTFCQRVGIQANHFQTGATNWSKKAQKSKDFPKRRGQNWMWGWNVCCRLIKLSRITKKHRGNMLLHEFESSTRQMMPKGESFALVSHTHKKEGYKMSDAKWKEQESKQPDSPKAAFIEC